MGTPELCVCWEAALRFSFWLSIRINWISFRELLVYSRDPSTFIIPILDKMGGGFVCLYPQYVHIYLFPTQMHVLFVLIYYVHEKIYVCTTEFLNEIEMK